ncbi:DUF58 domain-containing protein [Intrasporangium sp. YIM S08009]|uniref:DUF58 domain-containing protein n=1 Tax=Intrasporangium zincisolvens TaxID=3080018 RepID=UPI002B05BFE5|nr:DUF58 domain-containing protein [Intrasporangium sp. YIM S08009]
MGAAPALTPERLLRRLEWRVVRRLDGLLQGDYRSLFKGSGLDFTDLREYEPGDDLRHVEWNVTARLDEPWVREYVEDREVTAWLLLDASRSMGFGPADRNKDLVVAEVATTLAHLLTRGGSRVGAVVIDAGVEAVVPPGSGRTQVLRIARALLARREAHDASDAAISSTTPSAATSATDSGRRRRWRAPTRRGAAARPEPPGVTDLGAGLRAVAGLARRRGVVVVVSDFVSSPGWDAELGRLARRHDVVALRVSDPREHDLPSVGTLYVEDPETGEQIVVDTDDAAFRARVRQVADERRAELERLTRRAGADLHHVSTDEDLVRALVRVAALRRRRIGALRR